MLFAEFDMEVEVKAVFEPYQPGRLFRKPEKDFFKFGLIVPQKTPKFPPPPLRSRS
jgi:hypothetical protein